MTFTPIQSGSSLDREPLVFLPGWGFDGQVGRFGAWPAGVEVLAPAEFCHADQVVELRQYLVEKKIARVALMGWSMGANLAWQFASSYPEMVSSLLLVAARQRWPQQEITAIKADLEDGWQKSMQGFYRKCFLGHKGLYRRFVEEIQDDYLRRLTPQDLAAGLDYLAASTLSGQTPAGLSTYVIHGRKDVVAPCAQRPQIDGATERLIDGAGHLLFAHSHLDLL